MAKNREKPRKTAKVPITFQSLIVAETDFQKFSITIFNNKIFERVNNHNESIRIVLI